MGAAGMTYELSAGGATCAECGQPVRAVVGTPARPRLSADATLHAAFAWCMLDPCGHTFTVRRGGLIY